MQDALSIVICVCRLQSCFHTTYTDDEGFTNLIIFQDVDEQITQDNVLYALRSRLAPNLITGEPEFEWYEIGSFIDHQLLNPLTDQEVSLWLSPVPAFMM